LARTLRIGESPLLVSETILRVIWLRIKRRKLWRIANASVALRPVWDALDQGWTADSRMTLRPAVLSRMPSVWWFGFDSQERLWTVKWWVARDDRFEPVSFQEAMENRMPQGVGPFRFHSIISRARGRYGIELEFGAIWKHLLKTFFIQNVRRLTGDEA
jgi:hypothetical protein